MMGRARELLAPFNLEPSSEQAAQPCTFGDVRAGIKGLQILNAATLDVLQQSVDSSRQARDLTLREKIMCSIPVPGLGNLPPESGPFSKNPTVCKGVCKHIQAVWWNQRSNES
eukprot:m51a1_g11191 hypothetical protein (113) ;mRNA; r:15308-15997